MAKRILMVDDSRTTRDMVTFTLSRAGHVVLQARDGAEALGLLDGEPVDLVITDLNMPVMDGLGLITTLRGRAAFAHLPMLMLTTESDQAMKQEGIKAGATEWLEKPFHPNQLLEVVGRMMAAA